MAEMLQGPANIATISSLFTSWPSLLIILALTLWLLLYHVPVFSYGTLFPHNRLELLRVKLEEIEEIMPEARELVTQEVMIQFEIEFHQ
jgi:hypothetical protein